MGFAKQCLNEGRPLPHRWLMDHAGNPTDDPRTLFEAPKGTILPLGGLDAGHKGYALGLLVEALSSGLAGQGRADRQEGWGANVFVQVLDPDAFGGGEAFTRQTGWLVDACRASPPRPGVERVRLPGEAGLARKREQLQHGVALHPGIMPTLEPWAQRWEIRLPDSLP